MKKLIIIAIASIFSSCEETEILTPPPSNCMSWTEGDWWVYESVSYDYNNGDTTVFSVDTTYALADTMINGQLYRALSRSLLPANNNPMFLRDSSGYVVDLSGAIIYSYMNFTDTIAVDSVPMVGINWYSMMLQDAEPTTVPAGIFATINHQTVAINTLMQYPCGLTEMISDRQFAENVGMVRMSYHYASPGPCIDNVKLLVDYNVQ